MQMQANLEDYASENKQAEDHQDYRKDCYRLCAVSIASKDNRDRAEHNYSSTPYP